MEQRVSQMPDIVAVHGAPVPQAESALTGEKAKGIDLGAVDFISKPFDPVELLARVGSALRTGPAPPPRLWPPALPQV